MDKDGMVYVAQAQRYLLEVRRLEKKVNRPITEHPDVQRLIGQVVELQAENERLIELLKLAYRNWLEDPDVAWAELGEKLCDGLCESMGDKDYQEWMQALKGE